VATRSGPINTSEQFGEELTGWDERMTLLQNAYEKYFVGIERRPPDLERKTVSEGIRRLRTTNVKNTALRFRVQTLFAKLLSFERMWDRTLREIEEGTYHRDLFKVRFRQQQKQPQKPESLPEVAPLPDIAQPSAPPPPARMSQPPPASISESSLKRLYDTYLKAREQCGESNTGLSYDAVASKIRAQIPSLLTKHNARAVDFKVVIKGGRAVLKAVPKA